MTNADGDTWLEPDHVLIDFGEKVRRGYDPESVDRHLEHLAAGIKALRREVDGGVHIDDESLQVMMRAGRRSVEEALEEAREKASALLADAEAESERLRDQAHAESNKITAAGEEQARLQEETIEIRNIEIAALDEEISVRQKALRATAAELLRLADGIIDEPDIDLREQSETDAAEAATDGNGSDNGVEPESDDASDGEKVDVAAESAGAAEA